MIAAEQELLRNAAKMVMIGMSTSIVGFDSAWTDNLRSRGAVCAIRIAEGGARHFMEPELASFREARDFIAREQSASAHCLVALDQPTIVPNRAGMRPVDRVAASLISWLGGGVQPANRSKMGMFDDDAPIWKFKKDLGAIEDPERARSGQTGTFLLEVFPALALPTLEAAYFGRLLGPRYNPARRKTFRIEHFSEVTAALGRYGAAEHIAGLQSWAEKAGALALPRKGDQDRLDAVICALVGYQWLAKPRDDSIMIGDLKTGYMIAPASHGVRARLRLAALRENVAIDGRYD